MPERGGRASLAHLLGEGQEPEGGELLSLRLLGEIFSRQFPDIVLIQRLFCISLFL